MAQGGEAARPSPVEPAELGMAADAVHGGEARIGAGMFDGQLGAAAVRRGVFRGSSSDEFACQVHPGVGCGDPGAAYVNLGEFATQARAGASRGDPGLAHEDPGTFGHQLAGVLANGLGAMNVASRESARQPPASAGRGDMHLGNLRGGPGAVHVDLGEFGGQVRPGAGRGEPHVGVLRGDFGMLFGYAGTFAVAGRDDELVGLLADDPGAVYDDSGSFARQPWPGGGHAEGVVAALRGPNPGTLAEHLRGLLPVVAMVASSVAITGLAAGTASPAAGLGSFALLLGGLSLVMIHMLRA